MLVCIGRTTRVGTLRGANITQVWPKVNFFDIILYLFQFSSSYRRNPPGFFFTIHKHSGLILYLFPLFLALNSEIE